ncbi:hypothetical protein [uncultured Nisaea sp.]|uniref:hypothetical protein n=1 Tax=uncultured Nisaea sp. TaxID=538215 RepID=UPI0030EE81B6|tara:strand:+ start:1434 stop:2654 length:1221 start_codon:yes stop_codon:yes gene_type:complete
MSDTGYFESFDRQKLDPTDKDGFKSSMIDFCRTNKMAADALMAGNVEMLGLENLKEKFGPNWTKVRGKVHLLTETIIKKIITPNDVYVLANAEQFIVLFGKDDKATANMKARQIAKEVNRRLHGSGPDSGLDGVTVKSMVFDIPRDEPEKLTDVKALTQTVEDTRQEKQAEETEAFEQARDKIKLVYWPVTNIRKRLVSMYRAELSVPDGMMSEAGSETGALECAMDISALQLAQAMLKEAPKAKPFLLLPVHMDTLTNKQFRESLLAELKLLPEWAERRLFLYIKGLDDDVPQTVLHNNFAYISPFCAGFVGGFSRSFKRAEQLQGAGLIGSGCSTGDATEITPSLVEELSNFVVNNHAGRNRIFVFNAPDLDTATTARKVHCDYVDGPGVAPALGAFGPVFKIA